MFANNALIARETNTEHSYTTIVFYLKGFGPTGAVNSIAEQYWKMCTTVLPKTSQKEPFTKVHLACL